MELCKKLENCKIW